LLFAEEFKTNNLKEKLFDIYARLLHYSAEGKNSGINQALAELGIFFEADRVYIFNYDFTAGICRNTYEWCAEGVEPQLENLQEVPLEAIPEWLEPHKSGISLYIPSVDALPPIPVKTILEEQDIKSLLAIPLMQGKNCYGFLGLDFVKDYHYSSEQEQSLLKDFSQLFLNALEKEQIAKEVRAQKEAALYRFKIIFDENPEMMALNSVPELVFLEINQAFLEKLGYEKEEIIGKK